MNICAGGAVLTYALYSDADETVAAVGSRWMLITIPFVIYGVFRYLFLFKNGRPAAIPFSFSSATGDAVQSLL